MKKINQTIKTLSLLLLMLTMHGSKAQFKTILDTVYKVTDTLFDTGKKVAVLPIMYVGQGNQWQVDGMRYRLQKLTSDFLKERSKELILVDPVEVNAVLLKNGIEAADLRKYTPKELAALLKVEYILMGMVIQETQSITTQNSGSSSRRSNSRDYYDHAETRSKENYSGSSTIRENVNNAVDITIYNAKGENIYSRSRTSIISNPDSYKMALKYLLKRTPLYKK